MSTRLDANDRLKGLSFKKPCIVATLENVNLTGSTNVIDGVSLNLNDRILVINQIDQIDNGIYIVSNVGTGSDGVLLRANDFSTSDDIFAGINIYILSGDTYNDSYFILNTENPILDITPLFFSNKKMLDTQNVSNNQVLLYNNNSIIGYTGLTYDGNTLDINGNVNITGNTTVIGNIISNTISVTGGTSTQFLKADGSIDSTSYTDFNLFTGETFDRISGDTYLNNLLTGETFDRLSGDTFLNELLTGETFDRISGDTFLTELLTGETFDRISGDTVLNDLITGLTSTVNNNYNLLTGETFNRISGDTVLNDLIEELSINAQNQMNNEINNRISGDTLLNNLLTGETFDRISGDTFLNELLTGETFDRISGDTILNNLITGLTSTVTDNYNLLTGETFNRISGDTFLNNLITGLTQNIINNYVPYTGSTSNIDLGYNNLTASSIIKSGGTSNQFLKADGTIDITTYSNTGHSHYQLFQPNGTTPFVYTDNGGSFHIDGNIIQSGSTYETHTEQIYTTKDYIYLRSGATSGLPDGQYAGFTAKLYDGSNDGQLVFDNKGFARVGDVGSLLKLAAIQETPTDTQFTYYDAATYSLKTRAFLSGDITTALGFTPYNATNPSNYITIGSVPVVATTTPLINGIAAIGASGKWADGAHVHPVDTSRQVALSGTGFVKSTSGTISYDTSTYIPVTGNTNTINLGVNNLTVDTNTLFVDSVHHYLGITTNNPNASVDIGGFGTPSDYGGGTGTAKVLIADNATGSSGVQMYNSNSGTASDFRFAIFNNNKNEYMAFSTPADTNTNTLFGFARSTSNYLFNNLNGVGGTLRNLTIGTVGSSDLIFGTNNVENLRIKSGGNVGIGTTTPGTLLEISNSANISINSILRIRDINTGGSYFDIGSANGSSGLFINQGSTKIMQIRSSGNVGFGTSSTPNARFNIYKSGIIDYFNITSSVDGDVMVILNNGNVGIGATTPDQKLSVWGGSQNIIDPTTLGSESLTNGTLSGGTSWTATNDCTLVSNNATWTFSGGTASTLTQTNANLTVAGVGYRWYKFVYTVSAISGTPSASITTSFGGSTTSLTITAGAQTTYFKAATTPTDFVITSTLVSGQTFTLGTFSLKEVQGGNLITGGLLTGGGTTGIKVLANGNVGIGTTTPGQLLEVNNGHINVLNTNYGLLLASNQALTRNGAKLVLANSSAFTSMGLSTVGVERISIDSSGNVGIGVTPTSMLTQKSTTALESATLGTELTASGDTWGLATTKSITAFANYGSTVAGTVEVTSNAHGFPAGTTTNVVISGTTNYNGTYTITYIDVNNFYITATWVSNDATGTATQTGWSGTYAGGYTHSTGNTTALTDSTLVPVVGNLYQITYTVTNRTTGTFTITFGGVTSYTYSATGSYGPKAATVGTLTIAPTTDFNGTIILSIKLIASYSPIYVIQDSSSANTLEIRSSLNTSVNLFIGKNSGRYNTTGINNTSLGSGALPINSTGFNNVAIGGSAMQANTAGFSNISIGFNSLLSNTVGYANTSIGNATLQNNSIGYYNTAVGISVLVTNTAGYYNTGIGASALSSNSTGYYNTAIGINSINLNTTGFYNTALGGNSLSSNSVGSYNTAVGYSSISNIVSSYNTAIGYISGRYITGGVTTNINSYNSVYIGANTMASADGNSNEIVIGYNATGNGSNSVTLGNTLITKTILQGNTGIGGYTTPLHFLDNTQTQNQRTVYGLNVVMNATNLQQDIVSTGNDEPLLNQYYAWKFTASAANTMGSLSVRLKKIGTVTNTTDYIRLKLYSDTGTAPNALLYTSDQVKMGTLTTSYVEYLFGGDYTMVNGTSYWLVVERSASVTGGGSITVDRNSNSLSTTNVVTPASGDWTINTGLGRYIIYGQTPRGIYVTSTNYVGVYGSSTNSYGVQGISTNSGGVYGISTNSYGVYGNSTNSTGVNGNSTNSYGVQGISTNSAGVNGNSTNNYGVYGQSSSSYGLGGISTTGVGFIGISTNSSGGAMYIGDGVDKLTQNNTGSVLIMSRRVDGNSTYAVSGNLLNITDNPTNCTSVSGALISGTIVSTERFRIDPRVVDGASAVGAFTDTSSALANATAKLFSFRNNGVEKAYVGATGSLVVQGVIMPQQATTAAAPAYVKGGMYFDTTLNKMRIGGATGWETITSV